MQSPTCFRLALLWLLLALLTGCSDKAGTDNDAARPALADTNGIEGYQAEQVASNTWVIHGPLELPNPANRGFMNNPAFITTPGGVVIVDPGSSLYTGNMLLNEMRKVTTAPVIAVFNTHIHGDHWLGNDAIEQAYPEADIYGHSRMLEMIDEGAGETWIELLSNLTEGATDGTRIVKPGNITDGNETLSFGGHDFRIVHLGKAHTETDIMIHYLQDNVLFTGDNASNGRIIRVDHGSFPGNASTLQAGIDAAPAVVVPGHGQTGGVEVIKAYQDYLSILYSEVSKYYEEDLDDFEMKPMVHEKLTAFHDWAGYEQQVGNHISNAYLEIEANAF